MESPVHPGEILKHDVLEPNELSVARSAEVLGVFRQTLNNLLQGRASLTPDMALRFEKAFGVKMDMMLRVQLAYDIAQTRQRTDKVQVEPYQPQAQSEPQPELGR